MYTRPKQEFRISLNRQARTYTIREYNNGKCINKYRSYPQGDEFSEHWTENDIRNFLKYSNDCYRVA